MTLCKNNPDKYEPDHQTMNNVSHKKMWNLGMMQAHMEPLPTPPIKSKHGNKSGKDCVKLKLCRDLES